MIEQGDVLWAYLDPTQGKEQAGRRPVVVVSTQDFNDLVTDLLIVVPITNTDRNWPNHVQLRGDVGPLKGFIMTEQPRTIARERCTKRLGTLEQTCLDEVLGYLAIFLGVPRAKFY